MRRIGLKHLGMLNIDQTRHLHIFSKLIIKVTIIGAQLIYFIPVISLPANSPSEALVCKSAI